MVILRIIHSVYAALLFAMIVLLSFPFFFIIIKSGKGRRYLPVLFGVWGNIFMYGSFLFPKFIFKAKLDPKNQYIFCPNHFSYLDIVLTGCVWHDMVWIGKKSIEKVPVFGFIYKNLNILVDRKSLRSSLAVIEKSKEVLKRGQSLVIFPEGGIKSRKPPELASFRDGAFVIAKDTGIPLVPVSILHTWKILPKSNKPLLKWGRPVVIFHEPFKTDQLSLHSIEELKEMTKAKIEEGLKQ